MRPYLLVVFVSLNVISGSASAADIIVYNEPTPFVEVNDFTWEGWYIGASVGYAWGRNSKCNPFSSTEYIYPIKWGLGTQIITTSGCNNTTYKYRGLNVGIQAGHNWQFDKLVLGLETDLQLTNNKSDNYTYNNYVNESNIISEHRKIDWFGTLRARTGYMPTERVLIYATGGLAYAHVKSNYTFSYNWTPNLPDTRPPAVTSYENNNTVSSTKIGFTVGAGAEYAITDNWSLKGEYLYYKLGKLRYEINEDNFTSSIKNKIDFQTVRLGVNYRF